MVEHFCVKFGDPSCSGCWDIVRNSRQTDRQTYKRLWKADPATPVDVGKYNPFTDKNVITDPPTHSGGVQASNGRWRLASSSVTRRICNVTHHGVARGGPVVLRPVKATPCSTCVTVYGLNAYTLWRIAVRARSDPSPVRLSKACQSMPRYLRNIATQDVCWTVRPRAEWQRFTWPSISQRTNFRPD